MEVLTGQVPKLSVGLAHLCVVKEASGDNLSIIYPLSSIGIHITKIRRSHDCLIFIIGILYPEKPYLH